MLDTSMVKVVCKQCLKDYCPLQIKKQLIEIKRDITQKIEKTYQIRLSLL